MGFDIARAARDGGGAVWIPAGVHEYDAPIALPDRPLVIRGEGLGVTELRFHGEGVSGLVAHRGDFNGPIEISDVTITSSAARGGAAIDVSFPPVAALHDPTVIVERVRIRPSSGNEGTGAFGTGIRLNGCWSPTIDKIWIQGRYSDLTPDALNVAAMELAIDVGNAQEAKITHAQIACCRTAVRVSAPEQGKGEGCHVSHSAIVNAETGVRAEGGVYGGWAVPWLSVTESHLFTTTYGVFATGRSDVVLSGNSFCGSHFSPWSIGAFLADRCHNVRVFGNSFWTTRPGQGHGIVIDQSSDGQIAANVFDRSVAIGIWLTPSTFGRWAIDDNVNGAGLPIVNQIGQGAV